MEIKIAFKGRKRKPSMILCTEVDQTMLHSGKVGDKKRQSSASSESRHAERTLCGACNFLTPRTAIRPRAGWWINWENRGRCPAQRQQGRNPANKHISLCFARVQRWPPTMGRGHSRAITQRGGIIPLRAALPRTRRIRLQKHHTPEVEISKIKNKNICAKSAAPERHNKNI